MISAFGPEAIGENVEGKVLSMEVKEYSGRKYYQFELEPPHALITATAAGNRLYLFTVTANGKNTFELCMLLINNLKLAPKLRMMSSVFCRSSMEEALQGLEKDF